MKQARAAAAAWREVSLGDRLAPVARLKNLLIEQTDAIVKGVNQRIQFIQMTVDAGPVFGIIPLVLNLFVGFALLFHPGEILEVVQRLALRIRQFAHVVGRGGQKAPLIVDLSRPLVVLTQLRAQLLDATETILEKDGIDGLTITKVAKEAGCSVGSLYHHFQDKQTIIYAVLEDDLWINLGEQANAMARELHRRVATIPGVEAGPLMRWAVDTIVRAVRNGELPDIDAAPASKEDPR